MIKKAPFNVSPAASLASFLLSPPSPLSHLLTQWMLSVYRVPRSGGIDFFNIIETQKYLCYVSCEEPQGREGVRHRRRSLVLRAPVLPLSAA